MMNQYKKHTAKIENRTSWTRREVLAGIAGSAAVLAVPLAGCGAGSGMGGMGSNGANVPLPTGGTFKAPVALTNTATGTAKFSATLTAAPTNVQLAASGVATGLWAFNGISPGPMIDVMEGDTVNIVFNNQLSQESTIHWHGLPVPADQDGNPMNMVAAGGSRTYTFTLPVGSAGTYWFHPHPHMTTHEQVFRGLAGSFIVRPAVDPLAVAGITERVMMVTDLRLDANNQIAPNAMMDNMNGREGDSLLVNGAQLPTIAVQPGATERWRIVNATNARYLRLSLAGHTMQVVAHDGGYIAQPQAVSETLLAPGQRVEVVVTANSTANQSFVLTALAYNRGAMMGPTPTNVALLTLRTSVAGTAAPVTLPTSLRTVNAMGAPVRTQAIVLKETMGMGMSNQFLINNRAFDAARIDLTSKLNDIEDWSIENTGDMDHPFHIHGTQFQLVASTRNDTTPSLSYRAWIDIINVRAKEKVTIRIQQTMLGKRMFHCHILEHEDQGMMGVLDVQA